MMRRIYVGLVCLALLLGVTGLVQAQTSTTGQVSGTVLDPTGAVVSGAKLTLTSDAGVKREVVSDATGHYAFPLLAPGVYTLEASMQGFATQKLGTIPVKITETTPINLTMKVAAAAQEAIVVTAELPLVQSENATGGRVIEQSTIRQLPLPTRNFQQLLALTPGSSGSLQNSSELGRGDAVITVNGARTTSNSVIINGVDANAIGTGGTPNLAVPATDSMQEFVVQTSLYDATLGRSTGGTIAAVTKSGTNKFHGNVYEFLRSDALNANNFFLKKQQAARPTYDRNQFGGTLGGPIVKDKFWFFTSYQGTRETNGTSLLNSLSVINLPQNLTDDRSDLALAQLSLKLGAFGYVDPVAKKILQSKLANGQYLIPTTGTNLTCANVTECVKSTTIPSTSKFREDQFNTNLDYRLNDSNTISAKFFWANNPTTQGLYSFAGTQNPLQAPGAPTSVYLKNRVLSVGDTWVLSPTLLNDVKFGFNFITVDSNPAEPFKAADWGISNPLGTLFPGAPTISIFNQADFNSSPLAANFSQNKTYTISDMMTWTHGRHSFKFGGDYKHQGVDLRFDAYTRGQIYYLGSGASPWTSFISGIPGATIIGSGDPYRNISAHDFSLFFQDDWRVNNRLTINVGMRWDVYGPFSEEKGRFVALDQQRITPAASPVGTVLTAGFVQAGNGNLPGIPKVSDGLVDRDWNNIGPRIGFAFKPFADNDSLVFRGGYGVYYDRMNSRLFNSQVFNAPYYSVAINLPVGPPYNMYVNTADPFIHVPTPNNFPIAFNNATNYPFGGPPALWGRTYVTGVFGTGVVTPSVYSVPATGIYPDLHNFVTPFVQQYTFGFQWEAAKNYLVDVGYVGSNGQRLTRQRNMNQGANPGVTMGSLYPAMSSLASAPLGTFMIQTSGRTKYNALQSSVTKRYSNGLQLMASYTWSHSIDNYSGGDVNDLLAMPGDTNKNYFASSDFDRRHRFVMNLVYDLPKLYKGGSGFAKRVANDWEIAAITVMQSGTPYSIYDASFYKNVWGDLATGRQLPNASGGDPVRNLDSYFDSSAFVPPSGVGNFGSVPRNYFVGPGQKNLDMSIVKFIPVTETQKFEFRTEFFNVFNHTNFANPVGLISSPNFGKIIRTSTGPRVIQFGFKYNF